MSLSLFNKGVRIMKKYISNTLIILGILFILVALGSKYINKNEVKKSEENFINKLNEVENKEEVFKDIKVGDEIGKIIIPSLNIEGIIVEGTGDEEIKHNIGHFQGTSMPGEEGNFAIAGHSSTIYNNVFNNIHKINIGDEMIVTALNGEFIYKVSESFVVEPEDTTVLNSFVGRKEITIVTCTNGGKDRLIIKGNLVEE